MTKFNDRIGNNNVRLQTARQQNTPTELSTSIFSPRITLALIWNDRLCNQRFVAWFHCAGSIRNLLLGGMKRWHSLHLIVKAFSLSGFSPRGVGAAAGLLPGPRNGGGRQDRRVSHTGCFRVGLCVLKGSRAVSRTKMPTSRGKKKKILN